MRGLAQSPQACLPVVPTVVTTIPCDRNKRTPSFFRFLEAFSSRWWRAWQDGHAHSRWSSARALVFCPHAEQRREEGKKRPTCIKYLPAHAILYFNVETNCAHEKSNVTDLDSPLLNCCIPWMFKSSRMIASWESVNARVILWVQSRFWSWICLYFLARRWHAFWWLRDRFALRDTRRCSSLDNLLLLPVEAGIAQVCCLRNKKFRCRHVEGLDSLFPHCVHWF